MKHIDSSSSLRIAILLEMLEEVSRADSPDEAIRAYAARIRKVRPLDAFVSVSLRGLAAGQYRVVRTITARKPATDAAFKSFEDLPVHSGGFVGSLIKTRDPKLLHEIDVPNDPVLGTLLAGMGSCMCIPVLDAGVVLSWWLMFRTNPHGYELQDLEEEILIGNLFGALTRNLDAIAEIAALNERLHEQFEEVARVQQALLPGRLPQIAGVEFAKSYLTSGQAGGDYYDFFPLSGDRIGVILADVSGHGPAAATVMAMLHAILHARPEIAKDPATLIAAANTQLAKRSIEGTHITAVYGVLDPQDRTFTLARAGHPIPRLRHADGTVTSINVPASPPMGILAEGYHIENYTITLRPGDAVVLYTDGLPEADSPGKEHFGVEGLDAAIAASTGDPTNIIETIHDRLHAHCGSKLREDDQTLVVFRLNDDAARP